jgi:hypothetical protein
MPAQGCACDLIAGLDGPTSHKTFATPAARMVFALTQSSAAPVVAGSVHAVDNDHDHHRTVHCGSSRASGAACAALRLAFTTAEAGRHHPSPTGPRRTTLRSPSETRNPLRRPVSPKISEDAVFPQALPRRVPSMPIRRRATQSSTKDKGLHSAPDLGPARTTRHGDGCAGNAEAARTAAPLRPSARQPETAQPNGATITGQWGRNGPYSPMLSTASEPATARASRTSTPPRTTCPHPVIRVRTAASGLRLLDDEIAARTRVDRELDHGPARRGPPRSAGPATRTKPVRWSSTAWTKPLGWSGGPLDQRTEPASTRPTGIGPARAGSLANDGHWTRHRVAQPKCQVNAALGLLVHRRT